MSESNLRKEVEELKEIVKQLVQLETQRLKDSANSGVGVPQRKEVNYKAIENQLKEHHLGELVIFALKKDLIKRGNKE